LRPDSNWARALNAGYSQVPNSTPVQKKMGAELEHRIGESADNTGPTSLLCLAEFYPTAQIRAVQEPLMLT
jgi:hypothetical protein